MLVLPELHKPFKVFIFVLRNLLRTDSLVKYEQSHSTYGVRMRSLQISTFVYFVDNEPSGVG